MAEYKVLGASPKNLKALQNALTINGGKSTNGQATADLKFKDDTQNIELPSGMCLLFANNGVLSGIPLTFPNIEQHGNFMGGFLYLAITNQGIQRLDFVPIVSGGVMYANEYNSENPITFMPTKRC